MMILSSICTRFPVSSEAQVHKWWRDLSIILEQDASYQELIHDCKIIISCKLNWIQWPQKPWKSSWTWSKSCTSAGNFGEMVWSLPDTQDIPEPFQTPSSTLQAGKEGFTDVTSSLMNGEKNEFGDSITFKVINRWNQCWKSTFSFCTRLHGKIYRRCCVRRSSNTARNLKGDSHSIRPRQWWNVERAFSCGCQSVVRRPQRLTQQGAARRVGMHEMQVCKGHISQNKESAPTKQTIPCKW